MVRPLDGEGETEGFETTRQPSSSPAEDTHRDSLIGSTLAGRFQILEQIGSGGMGAVYRAKQLSVDRDVAVKVLHASGANTKAAKRFENEAKTIAMLHHPSIVDLIDFGSDGDRLFLVMELLVGESLDRRLKRGRLDTKQTQWIVRETCEALIEAHAKGIVHRDLKPSNLFIEDVGARETIKILDFGISRLLGDTGLTTDGVVVGTPRYLAPEQAMGDEVEPRTDIYSLGIVAYECLACRSPYEGGEGRGVMKAHVTGRPIPFIALDPPVAAGPEVETLIGSMLAKDPGHRPTALEIVAQLRDGVEIMPIGGTLPGVEPTRPVEAVPGRPPAKLPYYVIAVSVVLMLAGGILLLGRGRPTDTPAEANVHAPAVSPPVPAVVEEMPPPRAPLPIKLRPKLDPEFEDFD